MPHHLFEAMDPGLKVLDVEADAKRWEALNKRGEQLTKETYESWKEELHNLLIFAGLFSAIVTAFTIEAYKTVHGDPADAAVLLLQTLIVLQLKNQSNSLPVFDNLETTSPLYAQRINLFYSVSLMLSLVVILGGIVCLQWLREFGRNITGVSHKEDLSLQYQRHKGLHIWGVLAILNTLPLLLLIALGLFFTGFMVSQWESNSLASGPVTTLVVASGAFILLTSVLPTSQIIWLALKSKTSRTKHQQAQTVLCPYRSPQSWLFHLFLQSIFYIVNQWSSMSTNSDLLQSMKGIHSWMDYDTAVVKKWKEKLGSVESVHQPLLWISHEYRQTTTVAVDAYSCLVAASCLASWTKLKENNTRNEIKWEWKENELLKLFETENKINDFEFQKIRAKAVIDATLEWNRSDMSLKRTAPWSDILILEKSVSDVDRTALLEDIVIGLKNSENAWITEEIAVAISCHVIDQNPWRWVETVPILQEVCKHPNTQTLRGIRLLCNKLREGLGSKHWCEKLVFIFNSVFPFVDSAHWDNLTPILGRLLVCCDRCFIPSFWAVPFLKIIEDLSSKHLTARERSLDDIFLYTKHIIESSYWLPLILSSVEKTFNAILSATEEHVRLTPSIYSVLHPDQFTIACALDPDNEGLKPARTFINNFNKRLKEIWDRRESLETRGERSGQTEQTREDITSVKDQHKGETSQVYFNPRPSEIHSSDDPLTTLNAKPLHTRLPAPRLQGSETALVSKKIYRGVYTRIPISALQDSESSDLPTTSTSPHGNEETSRDLEQLAKILYERLDSIGDGSGQAASSLPDETAVAQNTYVNADISLSPTNDEAGIGNQDLSSLTPVLSHDMKITSSNNELSTTPSINFHAKEIEIDQVHQPILEPHLPNDELQAQYVGSPRNVELPLPDEDEIRLLGNA